MAKVDFRQGIVRYPAVGGVQQLLLRDNGTLAVTLNPSSEPLELTFASGTTDYFFSEPAAVTDAWSGFVAGTDYWLYWDINLTTGQRTFGHTLIQPVVSPTPPASPVSDLHWFDTTTRTMKVYGPGGFAKRLRVFAAKYQASTTFVSMSDGSVPNFPFAGTQAGLNQTVFAGRILFQETGEPVVKQNGQFFTTEDSFFVEGTQANNIRLESNIVHACAGENMGAYHVVRYSDFNKVTLANYNDVTENQMIGITTEDALNNETTPLVLQGVVTNLDWNWPTVGARLWVETNGTLVDIDPHMSNPSVYPDIRVPVAKVLSPQKVFFDQGLGGKGDTGPQGPQGTSPPASTGTAGTVFITTPPTQADLPTVVSDTDPRLSDARPPLPHIHQATDVSVIPFMNLIANNAQDAFQELEQGKLDLEFGGQMEDFISLHANPTLPFHAVTKQYVDALTGNIASKALFLEPVSFPNLISDTLAVPPIGPEVGDVYILPAGASGVWTGLPERTVVEWDGTVWQERGLLTDHVRNNRIRMGIAFTTATVPGGSFRPLGISKRGQIAVFDNGGNPITDPSGDFEIPLENNQVLVASVDPQSYTSLDEFNQYGFDGPWQSNDNLHPPAPPGTPKPGNWVLVNAAGIGIVPGLNLTLAPGSVLNVDQFSAGGTIDAAALQGSTPATLAGNNIEYTGSPGGQFNATASNYVNATLFGTDTNYNQFNMITNSLQNGLEEIFDRKASVSPAYTTFAAFPAAPPEGMHALAVDTGVMYYYWMGAWRAIPEISTVTDIPYDISFFSPGPQLSDRIVGMFVAPRNICIPAGVPTTNAQAFAVTPLAGPSDHIYDIKHNGVIVGSVVFQGAGATVGVVNFPLEVDLVPGDRFTLETQVPVDSSLADVSVTITGCASTQPGPCSTTLGCSVP